MKSKLTTTTAGIAALSFVFLFTTIGDEIDWDRAKTLRQKERRGQSLSEEEAAYLKKAIAARSGSRTTRGDGSGEVATVAPVVISQEVSPVKKLTATAADGNQIEIAYRVPQADRPLPAVLFFHGSLGQRKPREVIANAISNPTQTRFLAAGYVTVSATFRTYVDDPQSRGPILDAIAMVREIKKLPEVDPESVVIFGGSGGGNIALELAGEKKASPVAVIAGEPATVLYTGLMTELAMREKAMVDYPTLYTDERRKATEAKIAAISCPVLIHHGDTHPLKRINYDIVFPAIQNAGKTIVIKTYPGEDHGFYWGNRTSEKVLDSVVASSLEFIEPLLKSKPAKK
ncbi:MAG: alpha/beta hydrolase [Verrucomicrobiales bacterium]|nr:alpha/beta hydrolase [Verrucomicrobiales bacterium]